MTLDEIENQARELGISYWEAISRLTEDEQKLSPRAVVSLSNFQKIVNGLAAKVATASEFESPVSDLVKAAIFDSGYDSALKAENTDEAEARLENLQELVNAAVDYDEQGLEGIREFIDHSALVSDTDQYKAEVPVTLMTAHSAKGLEFPLVFLVGLEDGLFPHSRSLSDTSDIEEERRLCYVAMTRAERFLYVTHAVKRRVYGEELASEPSQFLNEMPLELIEDLSRGKSWLSFARGSSSVKEAGPLQYEYDDDYKTAAYPSASRPPTSSGKVANAESIEQFFRKRASQLGGYAQSSHGRRKDRQADQTASSTAAPTANPFVPGSYVRHAKYGRGLVLRREGSGDQSKLTVSFPGYGQKKLIEKYAGLEKA